MSCGDDRRVICDNCGAWACAVHEGHIGENCLCWPCDNCGDLFPPMELTEDYGLCKGCASPFDVVAR